MSLVHLEPLPRRVSKSEILELLSGSAGLERRQIGRIELGGRRATVEIPDGWELRVVKALDGAMLGQGRVRAWTSGPAAPACIDGDHFQQLRRLLDLESRAEAERILQRSRRISPGESEALGDALVHLTTLDGEPGLGGRYVLALCRRDRGPLPWTRLGSGSPVLLSPEDVRKHDGYRGVVSERGEHSVHVALNSIPADLDEHPVWRLDLAHDEVAVERQRAALDRASLARGERLAELRDIMLGERSPRFSPDRPGRSTIVAGHAERLNQVQHEAVEFALAAEDVALIQGPPGTGKTTAAVELIRRAVAAGQRVLATAPSNLAVDNVFERLLDIGVKAVRLGHPARVLPELRTHTLDLLVEGHDDVRLARRLVKEAMGLFRKAGRTTRAKPQPGQRRETRDEARQLLADARRLEAQAVEHILDNAEVLCATTTGIDSDVIGPRRFDLAVVDEACQSTEPGSWIPILRSERVVLVGDHCQLPPTVVSPEAAAQGFGTSLFERLAGRYGSQIIRRLTIQYRMHEAIMRFSSREFYDDELAADDSVAAHRLIDLPGVTSDPLTERPVEFIDTAGAGYDEELEPEGESRFNRQEAELATAKVRALLKAGVAAADVAVIAPYAAQVRLIREMLDTPGLEIDSVDGFQGREKEAVILSLVRSNSTGEIGFLADIRRTNVALTRARRKLIVIGDSATLASHPFYRRLLEYFEEIGGYGTVWEQELNG